VLPLSAPDYHLLEYHWVGSRLLNNSRVFELGCQVAQDRRLDYFLGYRIQFLGWPMHRKALCLIVKSILQLPAGVVEEAINQGRLCYINDKLLSVQGTVSDWVSQELSLQPPYFLNILLTRLFAILIRAQKDK